MPPGDSSFAGAFEQLRVAHGLSPAEVARRLDVYPGEVSRWRKGGGISIANVRKIAELFGADRSRLEAGAHPPSYLRMDQNQITRAPPWI